MVYPVISTANYPLHISIVIYIVSMTNYIISKTNYPLFISILINIISKTK